MGYNVRHYFKSQTKRETEHLYGFLTVSFSILFFIPPFLVCTVCTSSLMKPLFSIISSLPIQPCHQEFPLCETDKTYNFCCSFQHTLNHLPHLETISVSFTHSRGSFVHYTLVFFSHYQVKTACLEDAKKILLYLSW